MYNPVVQVLVASTSTGLSDGYQFQVSDLADFGTIAKFEGYRISSVDVIYKPNSFTGLVPLTATSVAMLAVAFDPDDSSTLPFAGVVAKDNCVIRSPYEPWSITINPRPTPALYGNALLAGYQLPDKAVWCDSDNLNIPHYGLKIATPPTQPVAWSGGLVFRYHVDVVMNE